MTRLSIVDQAALVVPCRFGRVTLAYNGEVYNWRSLRAELSDGTPWETDCDAEVVARAWQRWGIKALDRMNGMWGLALVDEEREVVLLARDRAGEKPLYYACDANGLHFASEIKALPIELRETACAEVLTLEFDCLETTPFAGVRRLGPGEYVLLTGPCDLEGPHPVRWWELPTDVDEGMTWELAVDTTLELLTDAIRMRMPTDLPAAVLLSGGLDSAIVQAIVRSDRLYTVSFPADGVDNITDAMACAPGSPITLVSFGLKELRAALPEIAWHLDTPATWTAVAQWFLAQRITAGGSRVWLSGEGADELFCGYSRHRALWHIDQAHADPVLAEYGAVRSVLFGQASATLARLLDRSLGGAELECALEYVKRFGGGGALAKRMARVEFYTTMQCLLRMADKMAAAHSIENRAPFLDVHVMELAARIPLRFKIDAQWTKAVLREVAVRLGVPRHVAYCPTKRGLFIPWNKWCPATGDAARGTWDRASFAREMRAAWRAVFFDAVAHAA